MIPRLLYYVSSAITMPEPNFGARLFARAWLADFHRGVAFLWERNRPPQRRQRLDYFRYPYDGLLHLVKTSGLELVQLYNRGRSYAFIGQVVEHTQPIGAKFVH